MAKSDCKNSELTLSAFRREHGFKQRTLHRYIMEYPELVRSVPFPLGPGFRFMVIDAAGLLRVMNELRKPHGGRRAGSGRRLKPPATERLTLGAAEVSHEGK